jgi:prepilin-type processing-associated H-X9-DG protein
VFSSKPGTKPSALFVDGVPGRFTAIPDGTANTIMLIEAEEAVPWTMPEALRYDPHEPLPKLGGMFRGGTYNVLMADGSVRTFTNSIPEAQLRARITKDGDEPLQDY